MQSASAALGPSIARVRSYSCTRVADHQFCTSAARAMHAAAKFRQEFFLFQFQDPQWTEVENYHPGYQQ